MTFLNSSDNTNSLVQLIIKIAPTNETRRQMSSTSAAFFREVYAFHTILPAFEKFQQLFLKRNYSFLNYPNFIHSSLELFHEYIILSDMHAFGFRCINSSKPVDYRHCVLVLRDLANFHAISFAMKRHNNQRFMELASQIKESLFTTPIDDSLDKFIQKKIDNALTTIAEEDDVDGKLRATIIELKETFGKQMSYCLLSDEDSVICHGDCWISNIMFDVG